MFGPIETAICWSIVVMVVIYLICKGIGWEKRIFPTPPTYEDYEATKAKKSAGKTPPSTIDSGDYSGNGRTSTRGGGEPRIWTEVDNERNLGNTTMSVIGEALRGDSGITVMPRGEGGSVMGQIMAERAVDGLARDDSGKHEAADHDHGDDH